MRMAMSASSCKRSTTRLVSTSSTFSAVCCWQLKADGWEVFALTRHIEEGIDQRTGITWLHGDALNRQDVIEAAKDCSVIVHAVNPSGYRRWPDLVLPNLWSTPVRMDIARLIEVLGREPHTPLDEAVEAALVGMVCIRRGGLAACS